MGADLATPIRSAIVADSSITDLLLTYLGSFPVFTRRPVPEDTPYPCIVVSDNIAASDQDGVNDVRPVQIRDVAIYGRNDLPATHMRNVNEIALKVRRLFHRHKNILVVPNWTVIDVTCTGPIPAPVDDQISGRIVTLTVRLASNSQPSPTDSGGEMLWGTRVITWGS